MKYTLPHVFHSVKVEDAICPCRLGYEIAEKFQHNYISADDYSSLTLFPFCIQLNNSSIGTTRNKLQVHEHPSKSFQVSQPVSLYPFLSLSLCLSPLQVRQWEEALLQLWAAIREGGGNDYRDPQPLLPHSLL